ncbi:MULTISPECIES: hypothetical protein [unclassified Bradyrhizobium]|uniref:hypothetical protein n=1 Tax=unclassified Bradyrhizobium TaxID=2631580 RepID=UPI0028E8AA87|nr:MULTISPECIES: hypothetical protein [unclassified Bradyrhizobium]
MKWDRDRISSAAFIVACACLVTWLVLTDLVSYPVDFRWGKWGHPDVFMHCIWLAPIFVLAVFRRSPVVTLSYALLLLTILMSRTDDSLRVLMYGRGALAEFTVADLGASLGVFSLIVFLLWGAHRLTNLVLIVAQRIVGVSRDG